MVAGASEVLVIADGTANPDWVAMDLFAQAEHDELAQAILLTPDDALIDAVARSAQRLLPDMRTRDTHEAHYWSRSRARLWRKGERSGHVQRVREIRLDCDRDAILLVVEPIGGIACHTGRERCFYRRLEGDQWHTVEPVLEDPVTIYGRE